MIRKLVLGITLVSAVLLQNQLVSAGEKHDIDKLDKCVTGCQDRYEKAKSRTSTQAKRNEAYRIFDKCQKDCLKAGRK